MGEFLFSRLLLAQFLQHKQKTNEMKRKLFKILRFINKLLAELGKGAAYAIKN